MYGRVYGHSVIAARLGWLPGSPPHAVQFMASPVGRDVFLSHDDAGRFFRACVETEFEVGQFEILFATSAARDKVHIDLEPAKPVVGFIPEDVWPEGIPFPVEERRDPGTIVLHYETQSTFFVCCASLSRHEAPSNLVSLKHRVAIAMKPRVAERLARNTRTFQVEPHVKFIGHTNAAVHLDRFVANEEERVI